MNLKKTIVAVLLCLTAVFANAQVNQFAPGFTSYSVGLGTQTFLFRGFNITPVDLDYLGERNSIGISISYGTKDEGLDFKMMTINIP